MLFRPYFWLPVCAFFVLWQAADTEADNRFHAAFLSITEPELEAYVSTLADDTFEGRLAGSRGGRASAKYITTELKEFGLVPRGENGTYFQNFNRGYRNILALLPGSDPDLATEVIVFSGHYDHIGYGSPQNSFGPLGYIHNGADDNASGVAAVLEAVEAFDRAGIKPRRSILFAFWDGEELGLLGSKHWAQHPTIEFSRVKLMLNVDMIGWLRENRLEVTGSRSGYGMRQLLSGQTDESMWLDFNWELQGNSDHWPFFQRGVPVATFHTGLHDHYHRPSDDIERINISGLQQVSRYLFLTVVKAANADELPVYRPEARRETDVAQRRLERPAPPSPPRIGISWQPNETEIFGEESAVIKSMMVTSVLPDSPADREGLRRGDCITAVDGIKISDAQEFHNYLLKAVEPVGFEFLRDRNEGPQPQKISVRPQGNPVRLGISWLSDPAEQGSVLVTRVVPGSAAEIAGLELFDRVYEIDGQRFGSQSEFGELVTSRLDASVQEIGLLVERTGQVRPLTVELATPYVATGKETTR